MAADEPVRGLNAQARPAFRQPRLLGLVLVGGAVGTLARYQLESAHPTPAGHWPWTTFWINVIGSLLLGALVTTVARRGPDVGRRRAARLLTGTGFCGGLTTYSTFVIEVDSLIGGGRVATGLGYALGSVVSGILAAALGVWLANRPAIDAAVAS